MPNPGQVVFNGAQALAMCDKLRDALAGTQDEEVLITMHGVQIIVATEMSTVWIERNGDAEEN